MAEIDVKFMNRNAKNNAIGSRYTIDDYADRMSSPVGVKLIDPETREPLKEIILNAEDEPAFKGHDGVLNECFSEKYKKYGHRAGMWESNKDDTWGVWFPKFLTHADGKPKPSSSGWINTITEDGLTIFEYKEKSDGDKDIISNKWFSNRYVRLVFAYIPKKDRYVFKGAFVGNKEKSEPFKHVYSRVATKVSIIGKPAYVMKLLDEDRSHITGKVLEVALDESAPLEEKQKQACQMDVDSLKMAAVNHATDKPEEKTVTVKQIYRDPYIAEYAKKRANGICQLCGQYAPFKDSEGKPYLESHHIIWLSRGGADSIDNTVALCPNCHKKMHVLDLQSDIDKLLNI